MPGPAESDLALVRLCTCRPDELAEAWRRWLAFLPANAGDVEVAYPAHWRDLLPLVALLQRRHNLVGPAWLMSRLRTAAVLEERRLMAVRATTAEMLALPAIATARPLVIGGLGIGETAYPHPASRHTGVATFMLAAGTALPRVALAMKSAGYRVRQGRRAHYWPFLHWALISVVHPSGFQVFLQSAPSWRQSRRPGHAALLRGARQVHCAGGLSFATPGIEDAIALVAAGIGVERNPLSLVPAVDSALLRQSLSTTTPPRTRNSEHACV